MPAGHTESETINSRRPLTANMRETLATIARREHAGTALFWDDRDMTQAERNASRALRHRHLTALTPDGRLIMTDTGRAALGEQ